MNTRFRQIAIVLATLTVASVAWAAPTDRQAEVAQKGAMVMPFDVHNSTHVFQKLPDGGLQQVVAKDASDKKLVSGIQEHLSMEAGMFAQGNYTDPMMIHGMDMPGLKYLSTVKPGQIDIIYRDLPNGAEIRYTAKDKASVDAIHKWFDAQLSDHGSDATDKQPG